MDIIKKNINILNFQCRNFNSNIRVWGDGEWKYNKVERDDDGNVTFDPFGRIMADFLLPNELLNYHNPYRTEFPITVQQIRLIYRDVKRFQNFVRFLCVNCESDISRYIDEYINLFDEYFFKDGDFLMKYTTNLLYKNQRYFRPLSTNATSFLDYIQRQMETNTEFPFSNLTDFSLETMIGGDNVNVFYGVYILSSDKVNIIIDTVSEFILENDTTLPNDLRDTTSEVRLSIREFVYQQTILFYNTYNNCNRVRIAEFTDYGEPKTPRVTIPLLITKTLYDLGITNTTVGEWIEGHRYYEGDVVLFNGLTYILKDNEDNPLPSDDNGKYFTGYFNPNENVTYFDDINKDILGFFNGFVRFGEDFTHWKRNVTNEFEGNDIPEVEARIDSQIETLRAFRQGATPPEFFDDEGRYRRGVNFNEETLTNRTTWYDEDRGIWIPVIESRYYRSFINNIYKNINGTFTSTDVTVTNPILIGEKFGFDPNEVGRDFIMYEYVLDECRLTLLDDNGNLLLDSNNEPISENYAGIEFSDIYFRFKISVNPPEYTYDFQEQPFIHYDVNNANTIQNFSSENVKGGIYVKGDSNILNFGPHTKIEHELGSVFTPHVESDVFIDRGISGSQDIHLKLAEFKSVSQLIRTPYFNLINS